MVWTREVRAESDEERERKPKKASRKKAEANGSGDEGAANGEPAKKKRKGGKLRRNGDVEGGDDDNENVFSGGEDESKPAAKKVGVVFVEDWELCVLTNVCYSVRKRELYEMTRMKRLLRPRQVGRNNCTFLTFFSSQLWIILMGVLSKSKEYISDSDEEMS